MTDSDYRHSTGDEPITFLLHRHSERSALQDVGDSRTTDSGCGHPSLIQPTRCVTLSNIFLPTFFLADMHTPKSLFVALAITFPLLLQSCTPHYIPFRSTISSARETHVTTTDMHLIFSDHSDRISGKLAVIAAVDSEDGKRIPYVIIAPLKTMFPRDVEDVDLGYAVSIPPSQIRALIDGLNKYSPHWDDPCADSAATFFSFRSKTETYIPSSTTVVDTRDTYVRTSGPRVPGWAASLELTYSRTRKGSVATIMIGDADFRDRQEITSEEEAIAFSERLSAALHDLERQGFSTTDTK